MLSPVRFGEIYRVQWRDRQQGTRLRSDPDKFFLGNQMRQAFEDAGIQGDLCYLGTGGVFGPHADYVVTNGQRDNTLDKVRAIEDIASGGKTGVPEILEELGRRSDTEGMLTEMENILETTDGEIPIEYEYSFMTGGQYLRNADEITRQLSE